MLPLSQSPRKGRQQPPPLSATSQQPGGAAADDAAKPAAGGWRGRCGSLLPAQSAAAMPPSVTQAWICYAGLAAFFPTLLAIRGLGAPLEWRLVLAAAVPAAVVAGLEAAYLCPASRPSTGLALGRGCAWSPCWSVIRYKLLGFNAILAAMGALYFITNEYERGLYKFWFVMLRTLGPYAYAAHLAYFVAVDGYQSEGAKREDMYHNLGRLLARQPTAVHVPAAKWANLAREYAVKAFFLPLMASFYSNSLTSFEEGVGPFFASIRQGSATFVSLYAFLYDTIFFVDTMWATAGYVLSCKLLDSHVRSAEPTFAGWAAALACYPPFVYSALDAYCSYNSAKNAWGVYFAASPRWLFCAWGLSILALSTVYCWATVIFGLRFSNLTNRGIITNGPYAFLRHPAYVCKNISWWMIAVPWSMHDGALMAAKRCVRLGLINAIYYARAKTEEAHLLRDAAYLEYWNALQRRYGLPPRTAASPEQHKLQAAGVESGSGGDEQQRLIAAGGPRDV